MLRVGEIVKIKTKDSRLAAGTITRVVEVIPYRDDDPYNICVEPVEGRTWVWYREADLEKVYQEGENNERT